MESLDKTNKFPKSINNKQLQIINNNNDNSFSTQTIIMKQQPPQQPQQQQQLYSNSVCISPPSTAATTINLKDSMNLKDNKNCLDSIIDAKEIIKNSKSNLNLDLEAAAADTKKSTKLKRNTSLISFKSFDFHIKSIYSGIRNKGSNSCGGSNRNSPSTAERSDVETPKSTTMKTRKTPFVKVETVDQDETETLLLNYPQSPYQSRRSSYETSTAPLLNIQEYEMITRSQASSPFLCPTSCSPGHVRRSSTSDIMGGSNGSNSGGSTSKKYQQHHLSSGNCSASSSRRPSTSDLLRKARERKGSESGMMGSRSLSHGGLSRGRGGMGAGRRTSIAF